ncbi:TetR/AcrR family transcriptional regulator [Candidatus Haliotispira prima]|uniref:TetR/AcrR family transcriptional regulator n=1 Tax=Candidatus Haliotispira prima TaxID=3034016 RepID=A0ABY8MLK3_9SPIO|nr:TetR/AcrR family transcriptional regulator [Candidatus Haliotispira prima]
MPTEAIKSVNKGETLKMPGKGTGKDGNAVGQTKLTGPKPASIKKRRAICQATLEVCQANGIGNATTAEIARRAGIAVGTLFCYYATKFDLLNDIYKDIVRRVTGYVRQGLKELPEYNKEGLLRQLWQSHVQWYKSNSPEAGFLSMVMNPNGESSPYISEKTLEELATCYDDFKKVFQSAVEQAVVRPLPPMLLFRIFTANTMTVASLYQSQGPLSAFLRETPQILCELENAAWDMIAFRSS